MILSRELHPELNLFDATKWPKSGPQPNAALLRRCEQAGRYLAMPEDVKEVPWYLIAGVGQATKTKAQVVGQEFVYESSLEGDGTVPLRKMAEKWRPGSLEVVGYLCVEAEVIQPSRRDCGSTEPTGPS